MESIECGIVAGSVHLDGRFGGGRSLAGSIIQPIDFDGVYDDVVFVISIENTIETASSRFGESSVTGPYKRYAIPVEDESIAAAADIRPIFIISEEIYSMVFEIEGRIEYAS